MKKMRHGDLFQTSLCFSKKLYLKYNQVDQVVSTSVSICFGLIKSKLYGTSDCWLRDMLNFKISRKNLWLVSPPQFADDLLRKTFLMLYSINWPNFIAWFTLLLAISGNICIRIICLFPSLWSHKFWGLP